VGRPEVAATSGAAIDAVEQEGAAMQVRGRDPAAMARAIARAAAESRVDVLELRFGAPPLDAMAQTTGRASVGAAVRAPAEAPAMDEQAAIGALPPVDPPAPAAPPPEGAAR